MTASTMPAEYSVYRRAAARGLLPDPEIKVSDWAERFRRVAKEEGPHAGRWRNATAPYLTEIMDCLSPSHPSTTVTVMKCIQIGASQCATNWIFYNADKVGAPMMIVHPTVNAGKAWVREKLDPAIRETPRARRAIFEQKSRDEKGSTSLFKKFQGGYALITGANSAADLSQHTVRFLVKDDWDRWPSDVDGQGNPDRMADGRIVAYSDLGISKVLQMSSPGIEGISNVAKAYEASDQRTFLVPCPQCRDGQHLLWENLKFNLTAPHAPRYICQDCGFPIEHHHKLPMLRAGGWEAQQPDPGRQPGFSINALLNPFTNWDVLVGKFAEDHRNPQTHKTFVNLYLGLPWKEAGSAPEWTILMRRAADEPAKLRQIPPGGLAVLGGMDVQKEELRYEVAALGIGKESWSIDIGSIPGDTADMGPNGPWMQAHELLARRYPDAFGRTRGIDMMAIDSGYNTQAVYDFVRRHHNAMAVKGVAGPHTPVLAQAKKEEVTQGGKLNRRGIRLWRVGAWRIKSELYGYLRKEPPKAANADWPLGYCHFTAEHPEHFFKELVAEHLVTRTRNGRAVMEWVETGPNHHLDTRVYLMAAAEWKGLSRLTVGDWQALAARLEVPDSAIEQGLFALARTRARASSPADGKPPAVASDDPMKNLPASERWKKPKKRPQQSSNRPYWQR